ncbi:MAG TPA: YehR family protein [Candidatus Onthousia faecavium]|nr:YehR family protein [Candidatus Onthousia faecavium]
MKKKIKYLAVFIVSVIFLTACGNNGVQTMTCTRTMNQNGIKTGLKYTVIYQGDYVTRVKSVETIETDSNEVLDAYQEQIESIYSPYKGIDYYEYDVSIDGDKLTSTVDINYEKIDTDKLLEIDSANGQLIKDGKIKLSDIKSVYEAIGAVCE